jgi:hypothetical protein
VVSLGVYFSVVVGRLSSLLVNRQSSVPRLAEAVVVDSKLSNGASAE